MSNFKNLKDIINAKFCLGCGACQYLTNNLLKMTDIEYEGKRPIINNKITKEQNELILNCCPGIELNTGLNKNEVINFDKNQILFGKTYNIYEGWAIDKDIRFNSSSGGIISALALYCLEKENMNFVLHTGKDEVIHWKNQTVISKSKKDLIKNSGSRYSPSSPCDSLELIENSDRPCVFIGKPCDVAAVFKIKKYRPKLDKNLGLVLSFFCAGTPNTNATLELIKSKGIDKNKIIDLYYRGKGWPGNFTITTDTEEIKLTYKESWGFLAKKSRQLRCHLCPDGLGEFSDITSGDAWHRKDNGKNEDPGRSIILVRSKKGQEMIDKAIKTKYITVSQSNAKNVVTAQQLVERRKLILSRLFGLKLICRKTPNLKGFFLNFAKKQISTLIRIKNTLGIIKRIFNK